MKKENVYDFYDRTVLKSYNLDKTIKCFKSIRCFH